jgi:hypothetical protein
MVRQYDSPEDQEDQLKGPPLASACSISIPSVTEIIFGIKKIFFIVLYRDYRSLLGFIVFFIVRDRDLSCADRFIVPDRVSDRSHCSPTPLNYPK